MKKFFLFFALLLMALFLPACSILPQTSAVLSDTGQVVIPTLDAFLASIMQPLMAVFVLVMLNFFLGVLEAIKNKNFAWQRIADYFGKYFLLNILGWIVAEFLVVFIPVVYPDLPEWLDAAAVAILRASLFSTILANILSKGTTLFGLWGSAFGDFIKRLGITYDIG